ncbi:hypothetical protein [Xanthomonas phaseoli]|uniref:Uncharacterized protein n=1 Tax=Xanthomonas phaseoli pv. dieffenbachiae TaxID=92828 RepID=A0A1V9HFC8_9XANT|nr:hypothetical protein [Xanthomonas phaseoli]MBO9786405.1 hypothetical protein [Xanthomonas phaseoli pv. dieffenbachiae]MBO9831673.1 hypothetical protein [Xanthomonas phaseoli pv. dieffenbachiae]MBO9835035.1 hypothetical protein [Xanthomonas phaseoli pv. dieffenbachiae]MBO9842212.1 hypothetical protein [Xanthomonas phaseoli pv. dieffenbachiae]MBO9852978.1 hypothetical protein [Xanthomonas phaseoli pv. dieffenbachiae]
MIGSDECSSAPRLRRRECGEATQPAKAELHHTCEQAPRMVVMRYVSLVTVFANMTNARDACASRHSRCRMEAKFVKGVRCLPGAYTHQQQGMRQRCDARTVDAWTLVVAQTRI